MKYCRTTRKLLSQDMMNPKRTTQGNVVQQTQMFFWGDWSFVGLSPPKPPWRRGWVI